MQPGSEEALDLAAAARALEPRADDFVLHDDKRRHRLDAEPLHEIGPFLLVDSVQPERAVVPPALQHLRQEPLGATTGAGNW